jgi:hypothetical protein
MGQSSPGQPLKLLAGEVVEVRSKEEILASLDGTGRLDAMPFMPEMLQYCGKRFRVYKRADKTCDNIGPPGFPLQWSLRRVKNAVHLTGVRCNGADHGNCDAGCLIFWHEAWLKRVESELVPAAQVASQSASSPPSTASNGAKSAVCTEETLAGAACTMDNSASPPERVYACQATDLRKFTSHLYGWDFRQYYRDIRSRNLNRLIGNSKSEEYLETLLGVLEVIRWLVIQAFNKFQGIRSGVQYPHIQGGLAATPTLSANMQPGEFVQVRSKEEIIATLDRRNKNRGLLFDSEMVRYCGGTFRIQKRVTQIIDEKNGKMLSMKSPCIILEGVSCVSEYHSFCPRAIHHYWREAWLRKVE